MRITTISYRRVMQVKPYESVSFEATAEVPEDEAPALCAAALSQNVDGWCEAAAEVGQVKRMQAWQRASAAGSDLEP